MKTLDSKLDDILKEVKELRNEVKILQNNKEEDLTEFTNFLEQNNELGTEEDLKKIGIRL